MVLFDLERKSSSGDFSATSEDERRCPGALTHECHSSEESGKLRRRRPITYLSPLPPSTSISCSFNPFTERQQRIRPTENPLLSNRRFYPLPSGSSRSSCSFCPRRKSSCRPLASSTSYIQALKAASSGQLWVQVVLIVSLPPRQVVTELIVDPRLPCWRALDDSGAADGLSRTRSRGPRVSGHSRLRCCCSPSSCWTDAVDDVQSRARSGAACPLKSSHKRQSSAPSLRWTFQLRLCFALQERRRLVGLFTISSLYADYPLHVDPFRTTYEAALVRTKWVRSLFASPIGQALG